MKIKLIAPFFRSVSRWPIQLKQSKKTFQFVIFALDIFHSHSNSPVVHDPFLLSSRINLFCIVLLGRAPRAPIKPKQGAVKRHWIHYFNPTVDISHMFKESFFFRWQHKKTRNTPQLRIRRGPRTYSAVS
jgi:hypothetical protein